MEVVAHGSRHFYHFTPPTFIRRGRSAVGRTRSLGKEHRNSNGSIVMVMHWLMERVVGRPNVK